jgi:molybdate transport system ATP-binding protein
MSVELALRHGFPGFLLDVDFRIEQPGITALFGPSGAGKTSVVNAIAGLLRLRHGRIVVNGRVLFDSDAGIFVPPQARRVGYVFQEPRLFPHMTVEQNLRFGWRRSGRRASEDEIAHIVDLLGLGPLLPRRPRHLSGGEKARTALGRALLSSPEILLLDEPLASLDAARKAEIIPYLERLRDEARLPMLYVSHALDEVSRLADTIVLLNAGQVVAQGSVFDVLTDLALPDFTGASPYGAMLDAQVAAHRPDGLTVLHFAGGELIVPRLQRAEGARLRIRVRAEDVMLALEAPKAISANNILAVTVEAVKPAGATHADLRLRCGPTALIARITRSSLERLALMPGTSAFAIIKSVTVAPQLDPPAT